MFRATSSPILRSSFWLYVKLLVLYNARILLPTGCNIGALHRASLAALEGGSCTVPEAVVTVLCTPDFGYGWHPKHVGWTCRIINKLLCVASRWTVTNIRLNKLFYQETFHSKSSCLIVDWRNKREHQTHSFNFEPSTCRTPKWVLIAPTAFPLLQIGHPSVMLTINAGGGAGSQLAQSKITASNHIYISESRCRNLGFWYGRLLNLYITLIIWVRYRTNESQVV